MGAFQTGTVADHKELFTAVYNFLTDTPATPGRDWTSLMYEDTKDATTGTPFGTNCKQCVLKNVGASTEEVVMIGLRCWEYSAGSAAGFDLNCYISWMTGQLWNGNSGDTGLTTYNTTWNRFTDHPQLPLMNGAMKYWIFSNQQRVIIVVETSSYYQSAYLGLGNRFAMPNQYPYPLIVLGSIYGNLAYNNAGTQHQFMIRPYITSNRGAVLCVDPSNVFNTMKTSMGGFLLVPSQSSTYGYNTSYFVRGDLDNNKILFPIYAVMDSQALFSLDGVSFNYSDAMSSESIVVASAEKHYVFQNINRINAYDFMLINSTVAGTTTTSTTTTTTTTAP